MQGPKKLFSTGFKKVILFVIRIIQLKESISSRWVGTYSLWSKATSKYHRSKYNYKLDLPNNL